MVIASGQKEEIISSLVLRNASHSAPSLSNKLTYWAISINTGIPVQDLPASWPIVVSGAMLCRLSRLRPQDQAWRKQYRVGPAKIGSSAKAASTLGRSRGMLPRENSEI